MLMKSSTTECQIKAPVYWSQDFSVKLMRGSVWFLGGLCRTKASRLQWSWVQEML